MPLGFKNIQKNISLIIILAILGVIGLGFYFLKPQYDAFKKVQGDLSQEKGNLENQKTNLENIKGLLKNYEVVKENLKSLSLALPSEKDIPNLLVQLESLAVKNGVLMESISYSEEQEEKGSKGEQKVTPQVKAKSIGPAGLEEEMGTAGEGEASQGETAAPSKGYATLQVDLSLSAHYPSFMQYLEDVQKNLRFLDIISVSFDVGEEGGQSTSTSGEEGEGELSFEEKTFDFSVTLRTYYLK